MVNLFLSQIKFLNKAYRNHMGCSESRTHGKTIFVTNTSLLIIFIAECCINTKGCHDKEAQIALSIKVPVQQLPCNIDKHASMIGPY